MLVDEIIFDTNELIDHLRCLKRNEFDEDKLFLLGTLINSLIYMKVILAILYCKEMQNINSIKYKTKQEKFILIPIDRFFIDRYLRAQALVGVWSQFELFFRKKINFNGHIRDLIKEYYKPQKTPPVITFFRRLRNTIHLNGKYAGKTMSCNINKHNYILENNKEITFFTYNLLIDIIKTSFNVL